MYTDFEYAGRFLSDFGCILCRFGADSGTVESDIGCDITFTTVKNKRSSIHSVTSASYEGMYTATFQIMKNPCHKQQEDMFMTAQESRELIKWLNRKEYHKFTCQSPDNEDYSINYYGSFNVRQVMLGDKILGLTLTFTANAPYGFGNQIKNVYKTTKTNEEITLYGDGDDAGIIYPSVKVTCLEDGIVKITNKNTGNYTEIKNCVAGEAIIMDGEHEIITCDSHTNLYNDFNYEFLEIEIDDTEHCPNTLEVSIPCLLEICYSPIRKVGVV